jgi:hypothetical protein
MYDATVKMNTRDEINIVMCAYLSAKTALDSIQSGDHRKGNEVSEKKAQALTRQGIDMAITEVHGLEPVFPVLKTMEYLPKSAPFLLQIIDEYSCELIVQAEHKGLASALWNIREHSPLEGERIILWVYTPGAGYRPLFDSVHAESVGHDHLHIDDEGEGAWLSSDFVDDPDSLINEPFSTIYASGSVLKARVHRAENEKDGHYVALALVDSERTTSRPLFELVIMLTPTEEEGLMI